MPHVILSIEVHVKNKPGKGQLFGIKGERVGGFVHIFKEHLESEDIHHLLIDDIIMPTKQDIISVLADVMSGGDTWMRGIIPEEVE